MLSAFGFAVIGISAWTSFVCKSLQEVTHLHLSILSHQNLCNSIQVCLCHAHTPTIMCWHQGPYPIHSCLFAPVLTFIYHHIACPLLFALCTTGQADTNEEWHLLPHCWCCYFDFCPTNHIMAPILLLSPGQYLVAIVSYCIAMGGGLDRVLLAVLDDAYFTLYTPFTSIHFVPFIFVVAVMPPLAPFWDAGVNLPFTLVASGSRASRDCWICRTTFSDLSYLRTYHIHHLLRSRVSFLLRI
jgi:hypothetical protein